MLDGMRCLVAQLSREHRVLMKLSPRNQISGPLPGLKTACIFLIYISARNKCKRNNNLNVCTALFMRICPFLFVFLLSYNMLRERKRQLLAKGILTQTQSIKALRGDFNSKCHPEAEQRFGLCFK